jgi:CDP-diacylglycerol--serine O-phosphatidyltransferase
MAEITPADPISEPLRSERRLSREASREHRRRRMRRHGRRAYVRSVYFLPSLATLGNAVCGFAAMYVAAFDTYNVGNDPWARALMINRFAAAAYLIFLAMVFDALDGRLARFTRHTTDFGGQLDSLADVVSFGAAPAFLALQVFKVQGPDVPFVVSRLVWAIGALYFSCAALRLARFNVSNEHGEQHHYSFLGLPSPGAGGAVVAFVLMQQDLLRGGLNTLSSICIWLLPAVVLATGLLMVSNVRYPHLVNRYLRGKRSLGRLLLVLVLVLLLVVWHQYTLGIGMLVYALWGPSSWSHAHFRSRMLPAP